MRPWTTHYPLLQPLQTEQETIQSSSSFCYSSTRIYSFFSLVQKIWTKCDASAAQQKQTEFTRIWLVVGGNFPPWLTDSCRHALIPLPSVRSFTQSLMWDRKSRLTAMLKKKKSCKRISGTGWRTVVIFFLEKMMNNKARSGTLQWFPF